MGGLLKLLPSRTRSGRWLRAETFVSMPFSDACRNSLEIQNSILMAATIRILALRVRF
jgi:hypothetical protein